MLKSNDSKTEVALITPGRRSNGVQVDTIPIGDSEMQTSTCARSIGVIFDKHLDMNAHVTSVVK